MSISYPTRGLYFDTFTPPRKKKGYLWECCTLNMIINFAIVFTVRYSTCTCKHNHDKHTLYLWRCFISVLLNFLKYKFVISTVNGTYRMCTAKNFLCGPQSVDPRNSVVSRNMQEQRKKRPVNITWNLLRTNERPLRWLKLA